MKSFILLILLLSSNLYGQDTIAATDFDMHGCKRLYGNESSIVIRNKEALDSLIRKDASYDLCLQSLEYLTSEEFTLLGINLNSGYCRVPAGLTFEVVKMADEMKYSVLISYTKTTMPCRALSSYDVWIKTPPIPEEYEVEFIVTPLPYQE